MLQQINHSNRGSTYLQIQHWQPKQQAMEEAASKQRINKPSKRVMIHRHLPKTSDRHMLVKRFKKQKQIRILDVPRLGKEATLVPSIDFEGMESLKLKSVLRTNILRKQQLNSPKRGIFNCYRY